jgi:hypothetical protein
MIWWIIGCIIGIPVLLALGLLAWVGYRFLKDFKINF